MLSVLDRVGRDAHQAQKTGSGCVDAVAQGLGVFADCVRRRRERLEYAYRQSRGGARGVDGEIGRSS